MDNRVSTRKPTEVHKENTYRDNTDKNRYGGHRVSVLKEDRHLDFPVRVLLGKRI